MSLLIRLVFLAGLGLAAWFVVDMYAPSRHVPWKPVDLTQPPGLATPLQVQRLDVDPDACLTALRDAGVEAELAPEVVEGDYCQVRNAVVLRSGITPLSPSDLPMSCKLAAAYVMWDRQVLKPAAQELMGSEVEGVVSYGSYSCRRIGGQETERPSEHATANAVDLGEFRFADGRRVTVKEHWTTGGAEAEFLRRLRLGGCEVFGTVIGPDYNAAHHDHLHMDMGHWDFCPEGPAPTAAEDPPAPAAEPAAASPAAGAPV